MFQNAATKQFPNKYKLKFYYGYYATKIPFICFLRLTECTIF